MGPPFLLLTVIWLRVQSWWSVGIETPPTISFPLDGTTGFSQPAVFDSALWLDQFLGFLHVPRPGLISASADGDGISLNIHMPLTTELLSPVSSPDHHGSPLLEFQRLPPPPPPVEPSRTIPLDLHDRAFVTGNAEVGPDATFFVDTSFDHIHDWHAWSRSGSGSPFLEWLDQYLSGHAQLPFTANRAYSAGSYYYELPGSPLPLLLMVLLSIALLRLFYVALPLLSDVALLLEGIGPELTESVAQMDSAKSHPIEEGFISELLENAARHELEGSDSTSAAAAAPANATSDAAVNTDPDRSILKFSVLVAFLRLSVANLSSRVRDLVQASAAHGAQIQQKDDEIAAKEQLLKQKDDKISGQENLIEWKDERILAMENELADTEKKLKDYESSTAELRQQHDEHKKQLKEAEAKEKKQDSLVASLRKGIDDLKGKRDGTLKELEKAQALKKTLKETIASQEEVIKSQNQSTAKFAKAAKNHSGLESTLMETQSELEEVRKARDEAQKELENQEPEYMSIINDLSETNGGLQKKLDQQEEDIRCQTQSLAEMEQLKETIANLQGTVEAQKARLEELTNENEKLSDHTQTSVAAATSVAPSPAPNSEPEGEEHFASTVPVVSLSDLEGTVAQSASSAMVMPVILDRRQEQDPIFTQTAGVFEFEESRSTGPRVNLSFLRDGGHQTPTESVQNAAHPGFPRGGGGIIFGTPLRNAEGIVTRPMTQKERKDLRRERAASAQQDATAPVTTTAASDQKDTTDASGSTSSEGSELATGRNGHEAPVEDKTYTYKWVTVPLSETEDLFGDDSEDESQEGPAVNLTQMRDETEEAAEAKRATDVAERSEAGRNALMESRWATK
ncbi:hypothetical protein LTR92_001761 [Exophiala xenobiotica]|nr:hypothetical protein LTR92_001761 [Exophiala xenobiotica]